TQFNYTCGNTCVWLQLKFCSSYKEKTSAEGNQVILLCNYTLMRAANAYLYWYKQLPNRSPTFILSDFSIGKGTTEPEFKKRFYIKLDSTLGTVSLTIKNLCVSDSHVYYCALRASTEN
uniref:Ig-like domain-containing protein n=1 Tax=Cyprinus carpio TaxID=7962 RepID=A0A8C2F2U8_CYPCA